VEKFIKDFRPLRQQGEAFPHFTNRSHEGCESPPRGTHVDEQAGSPAMVLAQARRAWPSPALSTGYPVPQWPRRRVISIFT
jgi:hypothetical protein